MSDLSLGMAAEPPLISGASELPREGLHLGDKDPRAAFNAHYEQARQGQGLSDKALLTEALPASSGSTLSLEGAADQALIAEQDDSEKLHKNPSGEEQNQIAWPLGGLFPSGPVIFAEEEPPPSPEKDNLPTDAQSDRSALISDQSAAQKAVFKAEQALDHAENALQPAFLSKALSAQSSNASVSSSPNLSTHTPFSASTHSSSQRPEDRLLQEGVLETESGLEGPLAPGQHTEAASTVLNTSLDSQPFLSEEPAPGLSPSTQASAQSASLLAQEGALVASMLPPSAQAAPPPERPQASLERALGEASLPAPDPAFLSSAAYVQNKADLGTEQDSSQEDSEHSALEQSAEAFSTVALDKDPMLPGVWAGALALGSAPPDQGFSLSPNTAETTWDRLSISVWDPDFPKHLMEKILGHAASGTRVLSFHLEPLGLGPVDVRIEKEGDQTRILLMSQIAAVRELLLQEQEILTKSLVDHGLNEHQILVRDPLLYSADQGAFMKGSLYDGSASWPDPSERRKGQSDPTEQAPAETGQRLAPSSEHRINYLV